ncbi:MAG: hypothetical protein V1646_04505 [bacterium]
MKRLFSKYSRYIFISLALCSVSGLSAMEQASSPLEQNLLQVNSLRQARIKELDEYRNRLFGEICRTKNKFPNFAHDENILAYLSPLEQALANANSELRLILDPDVQNAQAIQYIPYIPFPLPMAIPVQYIPFSLPMATPMHPGILHMSQPISEQSQSPEIKPITKPSSVPSDQTPDRLSEIQPTPEAPKLTTQQEQIGGILKRPSHPDQDQPQISLSTKTPVKTYASALATPAKPAPAEYVQQQRTPTIEQTGTSHAPKAVFKNRLKSQHQVETSKLKKTTTQQFHNVVQVTQIVQDKKHPDTQKEKKKSQITPEKQEPQAAPSTTEKTESKTPAHKKEHKAKKSEKTKTKAPKRAEETAEEPAQEVVVQPSEPDEEDVVDSRKSEPQTKEKPKLKQKSQKQKKKNPKKECSTQPLVATAASSNPQSEQPQSSQSEETRLFNLWEHGIEILKQLPSIEDDSEKRSALLQAISLFEQVFSLRPDINGVMPVDMDQIEMLVKFLYECFAHNTLVQALIIRINLLTDFDFEKIEVNKHDFIQNFLRNISEESAVKEDASKSCFSIWLIHGCLAINGIETERSESQAIALLSKIIEKQAAPRHIHTEAVELLAQITIRLARGPKPNPEKDIPLLKMCYKLIPHLIAFDNMQMATSAYIIAEQFSYELFTVNHERIYSSSSGESCSDSESWDVIVAIAEQALRSKISASTESSTQKKSKKQKDLPFTTEDKNELCALSALCFGKTLRHLKYGDLPDSEMNKRFLEKAERYLNVLDLTQIARGNPFNFTLAKVYNILSQLVIDKAESLKYLRIACKLSPESKVYKFDFATKLLSINPITKTELEEALSLLKSLADEIKSQTHVDRICVKAAFMFASLYNSGPTKPVKGFRTNEKLALEYLTLAANAGHPDAIRILMASYDRPSTFSGPAATSSKPN